MVSKKNILLAGATIFMVTLAACGGTAPTAAPQATEPAKPAEEAKPTDMPKPTAMPEAVEPATFTTWYQYDERNEDPKSDERVGNAYLRKSIAQFNADFKDKLTWINQPQAWDKMVLCVCNSTVTTPRYPG